jgi:hypothetical protein
LPKSSSAKTAQHPTARSFALDFCADDAALLTQGKEDKEKFKQKNSCGAVGVRLPSALAYQICKHSHIGVLFFPKPC